MWVGRSRRDPRADAPPTTPPRPAPPAPPRPSPTGASSACLTTQPATPRPPARRRPGLAATWCLAPRRAASAAQQQPAPSSPPPATPQPHQLVTPHLPALQYGVECWAGNAAQAVTADDLGAGVCNIACPGGWSLPRTPSGPTCAQRIRARNARPLAARLLLPRCCCPAAAPLLPCCCPAAALLLPRCCCPAAALLLPCCCPAAAHTVHPAPHPRVAAATPARQSCAATDAAAARLARSTPGVDCSSRSPRCRRTRHHVWWHLHLLLLPGELTWQGELGPAGWPDVIFSGVRAAGPTPANWLPPPPQPASGTKQAGAACKHQRCRAITADHQPCASPPPSCRSRQQEGRLPAGRPRGARLASPALAALQTLTLCSGEHHPGRVTAGPPGLSLDSRCCASSLLPWPTGCGCTGQLRPSTPPPAPSLRPCRRLTRLPDNIAGNSPASCYAAALAGGYTVFGLQVGGRGQRCAGTWKPPSSCHEAAAQQPKGRSQSSQAPKRVQDGPQPSSRARQPRLLLLPQAPSHAKHLPPPPTAPAVWSGVLGRPGPALRPGPGGQRRLHHALPRRGRHLLRRPLCQQPVHQ